MKVIDNFLPEEEFEWIVSHFLPTEECNTAKLPWFYNEAIVSTSKIRIPQFTHTFVDMGKKLSPHIKLIDSSLSFLGIKNPNDLIRVKANLTVRTTFHRNTGYHQDFKNADLTTAILYLNTNNGWTQLKSGEKVKSIANRMVIFPTKTLHAGVTCTDERKRVVINFNYHDR